MAWRATLAALAAAASFTWPCDAERRVGAFDATFLQIRHEQLSFDATRWTQELAIVRGLGIQLVIIQFSGDERGPYDRLHRNAPVAALLEAAHRMGMAVFLGLHDDPSWPSDGAAARLAPPLDDPATARALGELCSRSPACVGWYVSQEIEDASWSTTDKTALLREHLACTTRILRGLAPGRSIAIAPYFTGTLAPREYARWWLDLLEPDTIDIFILQDGVGTGRATAEQAGAYLAELRPALATVGVELWSVAELFHQLHGLAVDHEPFEAVPIHPAELRHSLAIERPLVERIVVFAVLDYMDPRRGGGARRLYDEYAARCRASRSTGRKSC